MPASRQAPRPSAFHGLLPNVLLSVAALIVAIVAAEVACRVVSIGPEYWSPRRDVAEPRGSFERVPFGFVPHAVIRSVYPSNPRGYFDAGNSIDHEFNSVGWRDMEHALEKPANTYRVLGLGDSYLYGQGVRYSDICLTRLQQLLQATSPPGITVETINTGISGFNTENERDSLAARGLQYEPDLVIVHFVLNDIEPVRKDGPYWRKGDLFLSLRNTSTVMLYRPFTNKVIWRKDGPWSKQHDVDILDDHRISIFNNNGREEWVAFRTAEVNIYDFATGEVTSPWRAALERLHVWAGEQGLAEVLPNDELFVEEQPHGRLIRLTLEGDVVWEYVNRAKMGRVFKLGWSRLLDTATGSRLAETLARVDCGGT
jgi:hypothetical protein